MKIIETIETICKGMLTACLLWFMGVICVCGATCGSFLVALVFIGIALVGGFWIIGLIWGMNTDDTPTDEFTGDDALGCISGKAIADEVTRGIKK